MYCVTRDGCALALSGTLKCFKFLMCVMKMRKSLGRFKQFTNNLSVLQYNEVLMYDNY